jgi:hypothetical protein
MYETQPEEVLANLSRLNDSCSSRLRSHEKLTTKRILGFRVHYVLVGTPTPITQTMKYLTNELKSCLMQDKQPKWLRNKSTEALRKSRSSKVNTKKIKYNN